MTATTTAAHNADIHEWIGGDGSSALQKQPSAELVKSASPSTSAHAPPPPTPRHQSHISPEILNNERLQQAIDQLLPHNYSFEIHKSIHIIRQHQCRRVALQMPEGLQMFSTPISTILRRFAREQQQPHGDQTAQPQLEVVVLADVTYGACCIDDYTARALGCDLLIHYGHSCLVPVTLTQGIRTLYVFVSITYQYRHLIESILLNFPDRQRQVYLLGTIQFSGSLSGIRQCLMDEHGYRHVDIPQVKPLSPGEVLGCTSPKLSGAVQSLSKNGCCGGNDNCDRSTTTTLQPSATPPLVLYVGDGRFHLESIMIQNPHLAQHFYRYDPYSTKLTHEHYNHREMLAYRRDAIETARLPGKRRWALVVGTLGRQGNPDVARDLRNRLRQAGKQVIVILLSELTREKLQQFGRSVDVFIQTSCPRLSIDWGFAFDRPLLSPYEAVLALLSDEDYEKQKPTWMRELNSGKPVNGDADNAEEEGNALLAYPMDFYAKESLGPWTPNHEDPAEAERRRQERRAKLRAKIKQKAEVVGQ